MVSFGFHLHGCRKSFCLPSAASWTTHAVVTGVVRSPLGAGILVLWQREKLPLCYQTDDIYVVSFFTSYLAGYQRLAAVFDQGSGSGAEPCSFRRFPAKALLAEEFGGKPEWYRLAEDKVSACSSLAVAL